MPGVLNLNVVPRCEGCCEVLREARSEEVVERREPAVFHE